MEVTRKAQLQLSTADETIMSLEEQVAELVEVAEDDTVVTYSNGKFTDDMRTCCISLLGHNVRI